ncbi:MAG: polyphosphate:AMP phosphotransferase [Actinobacteria bacterium]|nr:polyphosphate:AMP phosphotransferase [Actinomycetota bacterium]
MIPKASAPAKLTKTEYDERVSKLRVDIINAQYDLKSADFPVIIIIVGDDKVGAAEVVNRLNEWMDSRYMDTVVFGDLTEDEAEHPRFWRLWRAIPSKGRAALWVGGLISEVTSHLSGERSEAHLFDWARSLRHLQEELVADGALILKFFIHTPEAVQKKRMKKAGKDEAWRYSEEDWTMVEDLKSGRAVIEGVLRKTTTAGAPWHMIDGSKRKDRDLSIAESISNAITHRLETEPPRMPEAPVSAFSQAPDYLGGVDLSLNTPKPEYKHELLELQGELHELADKARKKGVATVLAFEGWDAGGKGGAIRRVTQSLEAGDYRVVPVAAPTAHDREYPYLWRFWKDLPRDGYWTIFDRTWYGRVLVERVEGFASNAEWQRAYSEIVGFEEQIVSNGSFLAKFWLHISPEEQLARFEAREETPYKKHKITDEDYRNREKWDEYAVAVNEMIARTSSDFAPWSLVPANDKYTARLTVLREVVDGLKRRLKEKK